MKQKVTITDVANYCNVSKSSVSRFLNQGYVSEANKKKIQEAIDVLGFEPDFFARRLKAEKHYLIGVVVENMQAYGLDEILQGLQLKLQEYGYYSMLHVVPPTQFSNLDVLDKLVRQGCDSVIFLQCKDSSNLQDFVLEQQLQVIFTNHVCLFAPSLSLPHMQAAIQLGQYCSNKYNQIIYIGKEDWIASYRMQGFQQGFQHEVIHQKIEEIKQEEMLSILSLMEAKASVIVCENSSLALEFLKFCKEFNIYVPHHVGLIVLEESSIHKRLSPSLTTLSFDYFAYGKNIAELTICTLKQQAPQWNEVAIYLKERESTSCKLL